MPSQNKIKQATLMQSAKAFLKKQLGKYVMSGEFGFPNRDYSTGGYTGASQKRSLTKYNPPNSSADSSVLPDLDKLRTRSRDLFRNAPLARGAVLTTVTSTIGEGLRLTPIIDKEFLKLSDEAAEKLQKQIVREFDLWAKKKQNCDLASTVNFYGMQELIFTSCLISGDVFVLLPWFKRQSSVYDLKMQVIEGDRVCNENNFMDSDKVSGGIELDENGAPKFYHICTPHPGSLFYNKFSLSWQKIPAFDEKTGRQNILHIFEVERPEQRRGVPYLSPVIETLKQLDRYTEAEIMAAVISSCFTVFIKSTNGQGLDPIDNDNLNPTEETPTPRPPTDVELAPGMISVLAENEDINIANPARPNANFDPFVLSILRQVGISLQLPYEVLIKHFSSSYSASRAAIIEAWKFFKKKRSFIVDNFCDPIYEEWFTEAVLKGRIKAPGFFDDDAIKQAYLGHEWVGSSMGQIDPEKEVNAAAKRVSEGFSTIAKESRELNGTNWRENHTQHALENNLRKKEGLATIPTAGGGVTQITDNNNGEDNNVK